MVLITGNSKEKIVAITSSQVSPRIRPAALKDFFNSRRPVKQFVLDGRSSVSTKSGTSDPPSTAAPQQIWFRVSQLADKHKEFTENAIRAQIFAAKPRPGATTKSGESWIEGNGLAPAIRKCGRSVLINEPMYTRWLETGSCIEGAKNES
ncbi:MAG TPA: hypothetical protein PK347_10130 [Burkholderiaceae bacterium]|nr:hypothetical protein [Burkholderiaceae bacterium]